MFESNIFFYKLFSSSKIVVAIKDLIWRPFFAFFIILAVFAIFAIFCCFFRPAPAHSEARAAF